MGGPELRTVKWRALCVVAVGVASVQALLHMLLDPRSPWWHVVLRVAIYVGGLFLLIEYAFRLLERTGGALEQERARLHALHRVTEGAALLPDLARTLADSIDEVRRVCGAAVVAWVAPAGAELRYRLLAGERRTASDEQVRLRPGQDLAGRALRTGQTAELEDLLRLPPAERSAYPLLLAEELRAGAALCATVNHRVLGVLAVGWRTPHRLSDADRRFLENVSSVLGVGGENLRLYQETQRMAALEERERLAREMHDGIAQALTYLKLKAEAGLVHAQGPAGLPLVVAGLEAIRRGALDALGEVRQAIMDLRAPAAGSRGDFTGHLADYLCAWTRLNELEAELVVADADIALPEDAQFQVVRIIQEALANARKHSGARRVTVTLAREPGQVAVSVSDDGRGIEPEGPAGPGHFGLGILRERAAAIGGSISILPRPGGGTEVRLRVPVHSAPVPLPLVSGQR